MSVALLIGIVIAMLVAWIFVAILVALLTGQAIRLADERSPIRHRRAARPRYRRSNR